MKMLAKLQKQVKKALSGPAKKTTKATTKKTATKAVTKAKPKMKPVKKAKTVSKKTAKPVAKTKAKPIAKKVVKTIKPVKGNKSDKKIAKPVPKKTAKPVAKTKAKPTKPAKPTKQTDIDFAQQFQTQAQAVEKKIPKYAVLPGADNERIKILLPILKELVKKNQIHDWNINFDYVKSANVYMKGFECEDELTSIREDLIVTIYEKFPDDSMGDAKIPIITTDANEMRQQILDAKIICASSKKPWFNLPEPKDGIELPRSYDEKLLQELFDGTPHTAKSMASQVSSVMRSIADVKLNAFEIHTTAGTIRILNSRGVDISFHKTSILLEAVLTYRVDKATEHEFQFSRVAVSPEQLDIQHIFSHTAQTTKDAAIAQPNPGFTGDVVLGGRAVTDFFAPHHDVNPLVLHTSARIAYMGLSQFKLGESIGQVAGGEPITISTYPSLPLGLGTMPVDEDGTPLATVDLIRNGVFVEHIATSRYAQYLDKPVTGNLSNVYVHPGATREEHLRGNNYFEIVGFSWFHPDPFSGDFSAEIRLGYRWVNGRKTAVRGGTFTGNIFKNILSARFSKETAQSGNYYGPRTILFKNAVITKFE